jgi:hypothetical protein
LIRSRQTGGCWSRAALPALLLNVALILVTSSIWSRCLAQSDVQIAEYRLKAVLLFRIAGYVGWPVEAFQRSDSPIQIGVMGANVLAEELAEVIPNRTVSGRPLEVRVIQSGGDISGLHVLFIGRSASGRSGYILSGTKGKPILTVTESEDTYPATGIINFVVVDDKVRFDVAVPSARAASLTIDSRLLSVARKVILAPT